MTKLHAGRLRRDGAVCSPVCGCGECADCGVAVLSKQPVAHPAASHVLTGRLRITLLMAASLLASCAAYEPEPHAPGPSVARQPAQARPSTSPHTYSLLAFGDSGYHYDYLKAEDYDTVVTVEEFLAHERQDWIEDKRPITELAYPPMHRLVRNGSIVSASGLAPVASAMQTFCASGERCQLAVMLGDNIYPDGADGAADGRDARRFHDLFVTPFAGLAQGRDDFRIYVVLGNHDWRTSRAGALAQLRFLEATRPFYMDGFFYRIKPPAAHGEVEIFALDTELLLSGQKVYEASLADDGSELRSTDLEVPRPWAVPQSQAERNMAAWLENALAGSDARWKIVIGHHPLWSSSGSKQEQARVLRRLILPALCRHADAYLAGHDHTLEVHTDDCSEALPGERADPLPQIVSGSAAKMRPTNSLFMRKQLQANPQLRTLYAKGLVWGFAHLSLRPDELHVQILQVPVDQHGEIIADRQGNIEADAPGGQESRLEGEGSAGGGTAGNDGAPQLGADRFRNAGGASAARIAYEHTFMRRRHSGR